MLESSNEATEKTDDDRTVAAIVLSGLLSHSDPIVRSAAALLQAIMFGTPAPALAA